MKLVNRKQKTIVAVAADSEVPDIVHIKTQGKESERKTMKRSSLKSENPSVTKPLTNNSGSVTIVARQLHRLVNDYFGSSAVQKIIAYYRVSTAKQGKSGLGLDGQKSSVASFVAVRGCEVLAEYEEIESGKKADRPQLARALAQAKRCKATLVVAKLDRLARNVAFLSKLMDSGVDFIAIDLEHANRLTIHILSAVAEGEAKATSDRTKRALAEAKKKGVKLGSARPGHWDGREDLRTAALQRATKAAAVRNSQAADEWYSELVPLMRELQSGGKSFRAIAEELNVRKEVTRRGKPWNAVQVMRVLGRGE